MNTKRVVLYSMSAVALVLVALGMLQGDRVFAQAGQMIGGAMSGLQEFPAISTTGTETFVGVIVTGDTQINYQLNYSNLQGTASMAHIHLGQPGVNGGIVVFLCGGGGKPACPASGPVTGSITGADIHAVPSQGIAAGELSEVIAAIRAGVTYANVHSKHVPGRRDPRPDSRFVSLAARAGSPGCGWLTLLYM